jgi:hypothetical protein
MEGKEALENELPPFLSLSLPLGGILLLSSVAEGLQPFPLLIPRLLPSPARIRRENSLHRNDRRGLRHRHRYPPRRRRRQWHSAYTKAVAGGSVGRRPAEDAEARVVSCALTRSHGQGQSDPEEANLSQQKGGKDLDPKADERKGQRGEGGGRGKEAEGGKLFLAEAPPCVLEHKGEGGQTNKKDAYSHSLVECKRRTKHGGGGGYIQMEPQNQWNLPSKDFI